MENKQKITIKIEQSQKNTLQVISLKAGLKLAVTIRTILNDYIKCFELNKQNGTI